MSWRSRVRRSVARSPRSKSIGLLSRRWPGTLLRAMGSGLWSAAMPDAPRPPVVPASVALVFDRALANGDDRPALVTRTQRWSYAELDRMADRAAHAWLALGVRAGDRVACALPNEADIVIAFHGAMRIGAVWV